ncbi:MAG TPA: FtsX-like permease family protein, partial [Vicinamibacterales bacterium]|nr:FtsX-like permease family protein [Vicinamibacterales bacterium]
PAIRLAATDVKTLMNESGRSGGAGLGTGRWLGVMTIAEIALAIVLVAGAGWLIRGFENLRASDVGFTAERRLIFDVALNGPRYPNPPAIQTATNDLLGKVRALPGVVAAAATANVPLRNTFENSLFIQFKGDPFDANNPMGSRQRIVSPGFFQAMGIPLVSGRDFTEDDRAGSLGVAVVNQAFVNRYLKGRTPIGMHFMGGYPTINPDNEIEIVGVVGDVRQKSLNDEPEPSFYTSTGQFPLRRLSFVVQTSGDPASLQGPIRDEIRRFDPNMAVDFEPMPILVANTIRRQELGMTLMMMFGVAAVLLAAVGIYGVVAYAAAQRRGEMATRLALGAAPGQVFWLVLKHGAMLAAFGTAIGLTAAYFAGRLVSSQIYAVNASDPLILTAATTLVVAIAVAATTIPALRASRLDPSGVLRPD